MKLNKTLTALAVSASFGLSGQAFAIGTAADSDITNEVVLQFSVGSVAQTPQTNTATFKVDNKIDLNLEWNDSPAKTTVAQADGVAISYKLYNAGNSTQTYKLTADHISTDGTTVGTYTTEFQTGASPAVPFPTTPGYTYRFFQEDGRNAGFQPGEDTLLSDKITQDIAPATTVDDLNDDSKATIVYLVVDDVLADTIDTDILGFNLEAQTFTATPNAGSPVAETNTDGVADDTTQVQAVFADAGNDGKENANSVIEIVSAKLEITKTVAVLSDPINLAANPKAIPGATVRYTITVTNTGRAAATSVKVIEDLTKIDSNNVNLAELDEETIANLVVTDSTTSTSLGDFQTNKILEVNYANIPAGDSAAQTRTITFDVDIK